MIVGFSSHRRDIGRGVMAYFFAPMGPGADGSVMRRNPVPELLCGDPVLFPATVQALQFQNKYRSGTLSFSADELDVKAFSAGDPYGRKMVEEITGLLEATLFPGVPKAARPPLVIGTHTHRLCCANLVKVEVSLPSDRPILRAA